MNILSILGEIWPIPAAISTLFILTFVVACVLHSKVRSEGTLWNRIKENVFIFIYDHFATFAAFFGTLWIKYDYSFSAIAVGEIANAICLSVTVNIVGFVLFYLLRIYNTAWHYVGMYELYRLVFTYIGVVIVAIIYALLSLAVGLYPPSIGWILLSLLLTFFLQFIIRLVARLLHEFRNHRRIFFSDRKNFKRVMVIGAGELGRSIIKEYSENEKLKSRVVCVIDDNNSLAGRLIEGVLVVGDRHAIISKVKEYDVQKILFAISKISAQEKAAILKICKETGCHTQIVPGISQLVSGEVNITQIHDVRVDDLLGREQINIDIEAISSMIENKIVMVTGGGGSIGSELCRQIANRNPARLIIFDIYENNAYDIQQELIRKYPKLNLVVLIGSVRNTHRINTVMEQYKPDIVFHAAAHKHVPLMEESPNEAIKNNVFGTYNTAMAAINVGVKKFVLISTDKAVNPTNIMGASKRLCEMVVQVLGRKYSTTDFALVRFGNVLGSNGSVIPLFKKQIKEGGPVTVTDPNIIRYFMTIPEAASLVLRAASMAHGGEIFVLDMGAPVKIDELARNMIRLSGFTPDVDIKIEYTGLRPGEKLYEEMLMSEEGLRDTEDKLIHIGSPIMLNDDKFLADLEMLDKASMEDSDDIKAIVSRMVPTYQPN